MTAINKIKNAMNKITVVSIAKMVRNLCFFSMLTGVYIFLCAGIVKVILDAGLVGGTVIGVIIVLFMGIISSQLIIDRYNRS